MLVGQGLGCGLGKDEEDGGNTDCGDEDTVLRPHGNSQRGSQRGRCGIGQVGAEENRGKELLRALKHAGDSPCPLHLGEQHVLQLDALHGEESRFRAAEEGGEEDAADKQDYV